MMPSMSVTLDTGQISYIENTSGDEQSFSDRLREVVDKGIEMEERGSDSL